MRRYRSGLELALDHIVPVCMAPEQPAYNIEEGSFH